MSKETILIVDDEKAIRTSIRMILEYEGYRVVEAENGRSALEMLGNKRPDVILLDIKMPGMDGLEVLSHIKSETIDVPTIILSGHGTVQSAVQAIKSGAYDFLEKPPERNRILITIKNALKMKKLAKKITQQSRFTAPELIGNSRAIKELLQLVKKVASSDLSVLIRGESGSGKELVARSIHYQSPRARESFIQVNCAAIPEELIESELFGHEKGSFTGAFTKRYGKFELAHKGTLFLDEIGDMSLRTQAKVLRAIQEGEFQRVGGSKIIYSDVRIIAATNQDLEEMIAEGTFRQDLYYRINVFPIYVPPLRDRLEDLPQLIEYFSKKFQEKNGTPVARFSNESIKIMKAYSWPGNVRELKNFVERHLILSPGEDVRSDQIASDLKVSCDKNISVNTVKIKQDTSLQTFKENAEKQFLIDKLEEHNWNIKATAEAIGTPRSNLYKRMQYYGIKRRNLKE